ncbi:MAG: hypothetical protein ABSD02_06755 [Steroidobacteraceae bacterium]|jgi:hypothetical protein
MEKPAVLKKIGFCALLIALSGAASAKDSCQPSGWFSFFEPACTPVGHHGSPVTAPEIDASSAISALTLVLGGLVVIRSRRKNSAT